MRRILLPLVLVLLAVPVLDFVSQLIAWTVATLF